jgi:hypothetical protein
MVMSGMIVPDVTNPIQVVNPSYVATSVAVTVRFQFPAGSPGLVYNQFLALQFPFLPSTDFNGSTTSGSPAAPNFSCALSDGKINFAVLPTASIVGQINASLAAETNIAYCQLVDPINSLLSAGTTYIFTVTLTANAVASRWWRNVSIFSSTANYPEKIIIDSLAVIGTVGTYGDWTTTTNKPLQISNCVATVTTGPSASQASGGISSIYPYNVFDIAVSVKINARIDMDSLILISYPASMVTPASTVTSTDYNSAIALQKALVGSFTISPFTGNYLIFSGITSDLVPNQQFILNLKGWSALPSIQSSQNIEISVLYKNTYSIISYDKYSVFTILSASLELKANHPDYFDIYSSLAWPIQFTYTVNSALPAGYIIISNVGSVSSKFRFIASTCSFYDASTTFDMSFGKQPVCFPLERNVQNAAHSGIFFKVPAVAISKTYSVLVWGIAEVCGTSWSVVATGDENTAAYTNLTFQIQYFNSILTTKLAEDRFAGLPIGASTTINMTQRCTNGLLSNTSTLSTAAATYGASIGIYALSNTLSTKVGLGPNVLAANLLLKEIWNIDIFAVSSASANVDLGTAPANPDGLYLYDHTAKPRFLFDASAAVGSQSVFIRGNFLLPASGSAVLTSTLIPTIAAVGSVQLNGRLEIYFTRKWFTGGAWNPLGAKASTPVCFVGWSMYDNQLYTKALSNVSLNASYEAKDGNTTKFEGAGPNVIAEPLLQYVKTYVTAKVAPNCIFQTSNTNALYHTDTIDANSTSLPQKVDGAPGIYKIVSHLNTYSTNTAEGEVSLFQFPDKGIPDGAGPAVLNKNNPATSTTAAVATKNANLWMYTSCLKWTATPAVTSIFDYLDIHFRSSIQNFNNTSVYTVGAVIRVIVMFPQLSSFHNFTKAVTPTHTAAFSNTSAIGHYGLGSFLSTSSQGICITQIEAAAVSGSAYTNANTMVIFLTNIMLLDTDYNDTSATYPLSQVTANVSAYGRSSTFPYADPSIHTKAYKQWDISNSDYATVDGAARTQMLKSYTAQANYYVFTSTYTITYDSYYNFFGSTIWLTGITSGNATVTVSSSATDLLIPHYCWDYQNQAPPRISYAHLSATNYSSLPTLIDRIVNYVASDVYSFNDKMAPITNTIMKPGAIANSAYTSGNVSVSQITVFFDKYVSASTTKDSDLFLYNLVPATPLSSTVNQTAMALFLAPSIQFTSTTGVTQGTNLTASPSGSYSSSTITYILGKPFNKAIMAIPSTQIGLSKSSIVNINNTIPTIKFTGVARPALSTFVVNNSYFNTLDLVAFGSCSKTRAEADLVTNFWVSSGASGTPLNNWHLDFYPDGVTTWSSTYGGGADTAEGFILNDNAGNIKFSPTIPTTVPLPIGSIITFAGEANTFSSSTICAINLSSGVTNNCTNTNNTFTCQVATVAATQYICCYNVKISGTVNITSLSVSFPPNPSLVGYSFNNGSPIYTNAVITPTNAIPITTTSTNALITTLSAQLASVTYSQVNQLSGMGKAMFTITLPRIATRNSIFSISGTFTGMAITGVTPRCVATFSNASFGNFDAGDAIIESCSAANLANSSNANNIVVLTKNIIYKCAASFVKTLIIYVWPINVINFKDSSNASLSYIVNIQTRGTTLDLAFNAQAKALTFNTVLLAAPTATLKMDVLCPVSSITPMIVGQRADYVFSFNLKDYATALTLNPNEVTIFFPFEIFGSMNNNMIWCSMPNSSVICAITDDNILNANFRTGKIQLSGTNTSVAITVSGIINPYISSTSVNFPCTVNNITPLNVRTNLITGSGKMTTGLFDVANATNTGHLIFHNSSIKSSDVNPRSTSIVYLRFGFDFNQGLTIIPTSIISNPQFIVTFPMDYQLNWYNPSISVVLKQYTQSTVDSSLTMTVLITTSISRSGNNLFIALGSTFAIPATILYYDLEISNVISPMNNVSIPGTFQLALVNSDYSVLFRSVSNLNNIALSVMPVAATPYLTTYRGIQYAFDNLKWIVDVYDMQNITAPANYITVYPGRYLNFQFKVRSNVAINPAGLTIYLADTSIFKTPIVNYKFASNNSFTNFQVGVNCDTYPGNYLMTLASSGSGTSYVALPVVVVNISIANKGVITCPTIPSVPAGGFFSFTCTFSEPNVDAFTPAWTGDAQNDTSSVTSFSPVTAISSFATGVYSNTKLDLNTAQLFKAADPNNCYTWASNSISIPIVGSSIVLTQEDLQSNLTFNNYNTDNTLNRTSLKFTYTPKKFPILLYCALVCINNALPSDANITLQGAALTATPLLNFYSTYITSSNAVSFILGGLVRGMFYQIRCIVGTTQTLASNRTYANSTFTTLPYTTGSTGNVAQNITTIAVTPTRCADFQFSAKVDQATLIQFLYHCQLLYSPHSNVNSGCVICTDLTATQFAPNIQFSNNTNCTSTPSAKLRYLQASNATVVLTVNMTYTVCAVQDLLCPTDITGTTGFSEIFTQFMNNLKTSKAILAATTIANVPIMNVILVTDLVAPAVTTFTVAAFASDPSGSFSVNVTATTPVVCYWQVALASSSFTVASIQSCTSAWCGNVLISQAQQVTIRNTAVTAFAQGSSYIMNYFCYNKVVNPQFPSAIAQLGTFNTPAPPVINCPKPGTSPDANGLCYCNDSNGTSVIQASDYSNCSASFINLSLAVLFGLILLLL